MDDFKLIQLSVNTLLLSSAAILLGIASHDHPELSETLDVLIGSIQRVSELCGARLESALPNEENEENQNSENTL